MLWYRRSVRAQLFLIFILIHLLAVAAAGGVTSLRARSQIGVEIAASLRLAELFVAETIGTLHEEAAPERTLATLPAQLRFLRHVRVEVKDAAGDVIRSAGRTGPGSPNADGAKAPAWFAALIAPSSGSREVPVVVDGRPLGSVLVIGEPADEIAEIWANAVAFGTLAGGANVGLVAVLYLLFGRVLAPLTGLARALHELERENYQVRLERPKAAELAALADGFNALARTLDEARAENTRLSSRLVTSQDDERRRMAIELHDEVGPSLFGLKAFAAGLAAAAEKLPDSERIKFRERVADMLGTIEHLQAINRSVLARLRPMALGHVPVEQLLAGLVQDRARQHPEVAFQFCAADLAHSYGDSIDLTLYRCVQEGLTNALRHAGPRKIDVELRSVDDGDAGPTRLELAIADDGRGIAAGVPAGYGMLGMRERVEALGGRLAISGAPRGGTKIRIELPLPARHATQTNSQPAAALA